MRWLVWGWTMTVPWTLQFSTHIYNPSYVLAGAIVFFIGFFEALPALRVGVLLAQEAADFARRRRRAGRERHGQQWHVALPEGTGRLTAGATPR